MTLKILIKLVPGIGWLKNYSSQFAVADLIAGITVGLTVLPQSLAYAALAGLQPQYGLYSAFIGGILYALFGGCREVTIGPTALLSLMIGKHTGLGGQSGPHLAVLLCFLSGIVELIMGIIRLGSLVDLISMPVTVGFTSATAVIIIASQLKGLLGLSGGSSDGFIATLRSIYTNINEFRVGDVCLGFCGIIILLLLRKLKDLKGTANASKHRKAIGYILWIISLSRNALFVLFSTLIAFYADNMDKKPFLLTGTVRSGLPDFAIPPFKTTRIDSIGNETDMNFWDMISELGASIVLVPIIAVLGNVAISKAFSGSSVNATRELYALSLINIFGSFVSSFPVTGSFSRSAVNHASGVKTPLGGIYTSILIVLALAILTPYFRFIPKAALSAVIITAVIFIIEYEVIRPLWYCSRRELFPGAVTFILSLCVGVEIGLLVGVMIDCAFVIYRTARPILNIEKKVTRSEIEYILVHPLHSLLYFPAIEWVRSGIANTVNKYGAIPIVLDCRYFNEFDFTVARGLASLHEELEKLGTRFILLGPSESVKAVLKGATTINMLHVTDESNLSEFLNGTVSGNNDSLTPLLGILLHNHEKEK